GLAAADRPRAPALPGPPVPPDIRAAAVESASERRTICAYLRGCGGGPSIDQSSPRRRHPPTRARARQGPNFPRIPAIGRWASEPPDYDDSMDSGRITTLSLAGLLLLAGCGDDSPSTTETASSTDATTDATTTSRSE